MGYTRRDFLAHLSLGFGSIAATPGLHMLTKVNNFLSRAGLSELPDDEKLGIALVGLGGYASGQLAPALQETKLCKLSGIVTGTPEKEKIWADKYDIPEENIYNYETYDQIADNDDIDIIYVVLPNSMHAEYTIRAAEADKHVICEKPMATSVEDSQRMLEACRQAKRKLSIGYRLHFEPYNQHMMHAGQNEVFGPVQQMSGEHSFPLNDPTAWRRDQELAGGGPLMDVGIYVIQAGIYTYGHLPTSVMAWDKTQDTESFTDVEGTIEWDLNFPDDVTLHGRSSYEEGGNNFRVEASEGWAELSPAYSYGGIQGETSKGPMDFPQVNQQALQMDDFARCILEDEPSIVPGEMGKRDMITMEAIYKSAETGNEIMLNFDKDSNFLDPVTD
ncbi:Gfo/Idh/MocA family protein [Fodinibius salsisoli]|uniref:Gfo/Idh/MocA family oxidoreductase n=1 Tax=Fodinibius salsisoli TaxID=2820877 RepID=A0ABT3PRE3_9BACT|nr:Gfo/Idh/MocA family oxidoreductase [Fodinibius salsisoli]MCW9708430.1 Gfo/Idh/MocA family oxidoreductase [Fodinibius salsisoli]